MVRCGYIEENTFFPRILDNQGMGLIGQYCFISYGEPFFLKIDVTVAFFHKFGNFSELRDLLKSGVSGSTINPRPHRGGMPPSMSFFLK